MFDARHRPATRHITRTPLARQRHSLAERTDSNALLGRLVRLALKFLF
jgi:hypothetical protein